MIISFVETEAADERYFAEALREHDLHFVDSLDAVRPDTELLSTFIYSRVDPEFLHGHPLLRLVTTRSARFDHIDTMACRVRGITVCNVPDYNTIGVAEHTFTLLLALARQLPKIFAPNKMYRSFSFEATRGFNLQGKTFGIIGTGRIGLRVIRIARAFQMKVVAYDTAPQPLMSELFGFEYCPFERVLAEADILSLHIPINSDTHRLLNRRTLGFCKRGVILLNTSRGALIDTDALSEGLDSGAIGGAGLDVLDAELSFPQEPINIIREQIIEHLADTEEGTPPTPRHNIHRVAEIQRLMRNSSIMHRDNVIFTPHIGFNSREVVAELNRTTLENITLFLRGRPHNEVDYFAPKMAPEL